MKFNSNIIFEKLGLKGFYHFVYLAMILSVTGSLYSLFVSWNMINIGQRISSIMGLVIQALFTCLFKWLRDTSPKANQPQKSELKSTDDMVKLMIIQEEKPKEVAENERKDEAIKKST